MSPCGYPRLYELELNDPEEEAFVSEAVGGKKLAPGTHLHSVERFWSGKWEVFLERADFLACQRVAALWHRRKIKMRIRDKETGLLMDEKLHTGKLSKHQEEIMRSFTIQIGP